jgi:hypothetical protein
MALDRYAGLADPIISDAEKSELAFIKDRVASDRDGHPGLLSISLHPGSARIAVVR